MRVKDELGRFGEQLAARHLEASGLTIIDRNWRCRRGELDLVAREGDALVVAEVKTRSSTFFGSPAEAIGHVKANRIRMLATMWIAERRTSGIGLAPFAEVRFDVVAVLRPRNGGPIEIDHLRGAF